MTESFRKIPITGFFARLRNSIRKLFRRPYYELYEDVETKEQFAIVIGVKVSTPRSPSMRQKVHRVKDNNADYTVKN